MEFDVSKRHCFYFNEISKIPRGSRNEKAISDYIVAFALEHGLDFKQDDVFNVIVHKPASEGYEQCEPVMMQAHIDMVNEKNRDVEHDFEKDPLDLYVEDGWLKAKGTTLGADDGFGVAYMLAILEDLSLNHPPLTCFFTTMEEIGLLGAAQLKKEDLTSNRYINLDGGGEVVTDVSSAGAATVKIHCPISYEENTDSAYQLEIRGLKGGHSGGDIHLELGNANYLAARICHTLTEKDIDIQLVSFTGGMKFNAIPRECDVIFTSKQDEKEVREVIQQISNDIQRELQESDAGFTTNVISTTADKHIKKEDSDAFIKFVFLMPNGFQHRSMAIEGLTVASLNAGVITTSDNEICIEDLIRSALASHTDEILSKLNALASLFQYEVELEDRYGGWEYAPVSPLRDLLKEVNRKHGIEIKELATHGGLECGIFKSLNPDLDIITYGPILHDYHTPDERLDLASFDRAYGILCELLEACK